ncbi:hypothetical protein F3D3_2947 [Fusibacter sp. 3D3]|nr:hypothetical protein F3D3_2947 [Fusibacter sp. 3D3]
MLSNGSLNMNKNLPIYRGCDNISSRVTKLAKRTEYTL